MLALPIRPSAFLAEILTPALSLLPPQMDTPEARVTVVAIAIQESGLRHRYQVVSGGGKGPARGLLQFERGGGCAGVLRHRASRYWMHHLCSVRGCRPSPDALWRQIELDDVLAAGAARLLLFTDPKRLPVLGDEAGAWDLYARVWRPGKPHRDSWPAAYQQALNTLGA